MRSALLILGQGLAGTLLAWRCERAGLDFVIADAGHAAAASRVGAGILNPLTGRRIVKSWRFDAWRAEALAVYHELEISLGVPLVRPMRVRRFFRDEAERALFTAKVARGALAPYAGAGTADDAGFWIECAAQVDTEKLIAAARARWRASGRLRETRIELAEALASYERVVVCTGAGVGSAFEFVPWEIAKGQLLTVRPEGRGVASDVILNRGHWALPLATSGEVRVGATYERAWPDLAPTAAARAELEASAAALLGRAFAVVAHDTGLRVTTPDRRPVVGWHPQVAGLGVFGGLGSKGALWAPALAAQWMAQLATGAAFDPEVDVRRFWPPDRAAKP